MKVGGVVMRERRAGDEKWVESRLDEVGTLYPKKSGKHLQKRRKGQKMVGGAEGCGGGVNL